MLGGYVVPFVYGEVFSESILSLYLLLPGAVFSSVAKVFSVYLVTNGRMMFNVISVSVGVLVTLVLDLLLIPRFGIEGAAAATSISYISIFLVLLFVLKFSLKLEGNNFYFPSMSDLARVKEKVRFW